MHSLVLNKGCGSRPATRKNTTLRLLKMLQEVSTTRSPAGVSEGPAAPETAWAGLCAWPASHPLHSPDLVPPPTLPRTCSQRREHGPPRTGRRLLAAPQVR